MKKIKITYWILTVLFAVAMAGSAIPDILIQPIAVKGFTEMGMPIYLIPFLGWAKLLGVIALFIPKYPRLREWAYAGLSFDLMGAAYGVYSIGKPFSHWFPMVVILAVGLLSYVYAHKMSRMKLNQQIPPTLIVDEKNESIKISQAVLA